MEYLLLLFSFLFCFVHSELINGDSSFDWFGLFSGNKRSDISVSDVFSDINPVLSIYKDFDRQYEDLKHQEQRQVYYEDSDCTSSITTNGEIYPVTVSAPGSTSLYTLEQVENKQSLIDYCVSFLNIYDTRTIEMGFFDINYDCIKIVSNPPMFTTGCVLPRSCGDIIYKTLSLTWLGTGSQALCYTNTSVIWQKHKMDVSQFDFGSQQRLCDYQNISAYYRLAKVDNGYRIITQSCYEFNVANNTTVDLKNVELIGDTTVRIHVSGNVVSQKICKNWDLYPNIPDAIFSMGQWFFDYSINLDCTNLNMTYSPIAKCSLMTDVVTYLEPISGRGTDYMVRTNDIYPTIGRYHKCDPFDADVKVDIVDVTVGVLQTSFFEMMRDMFIMVVSDIGTLIKDYVFFMMNNVTTPLLDDILSFLLDWLKRLFVALQPILSKYYLPQLFLFYIFIYYHLRDHFLTIVASLFSYLTLFLGETFINMFLLNL